MEEQLTDIDFTHLFMLPFIILSCVLQDLPELLFKLKILHSHFGQFCPFSHAEGKVRLSYVLLRQKYKKNMLYFHIEIIIK